MIVIEFIEIVDEIATLKVNDSYVKRSLDTVESVRSNDYIFIDTLSGVKLVRVESCSIERHGNDLNFFAKTVILKTGLVQHFQFLNLKTKCLIVNDLFNEETIKSMIKSKEKELNKLKRLLKGGD